jgi:hypothetical protein
LDHGRRESQVLSVTEGNVLAPRYSVRHLSDRIALASEHGLQHLEVIALKNSKIRWDRIATFNNDNIAWYKIGLRTNQT